MSTDAARTTRRFLQQFAREQAALGAALAGLPEPQRQPVAQTLLLRLLLLRFLEQRGLLGGDAASLQPALARAQQHGGNLFRDVLRPLLRDAALLARLPPLDAALLEQLHIPDAAWARLFAFFAQYEWQLDECAPRGAHVITPHILGAVLEHQLDQKPHGAYYTADDVSAYIVGTSVLPWLLDAVRAQCGPTFDGVLQRLLQADPTRYIAAAQRHGADMPLPASIAAGLADVAQRAAWNRAAPPSHGLPGESWRETVARRARAAATYAALASGALCAVDDCVTHNLDLSRLALDLIATGDAATVRAFWQALTRARVLDPTCGAGALLMATVRVLLPLGLACRARLDVSAATWQPFPNSATYIVHIIISNNLHGVDLMPEAANMCKLRLRLALLAQVEQAEDAGMLPEPVLHVQCGDVLNDLCFALTPGWAPVATGEGNQGFDVVIGNPPYLPHKAGQHAATRGYATERCGNLYALVVERALGLLRAGGRLGTIVPIASVSTDAMRPLQLLYQQHTHWHSHFAVRPGKLFDGVDMNLTITLLHKDAAPARSFSTGYRRWSNRQPGERAQLFGTLAYAERPPGILHASPFPKHGSALEWRILERMLHHGHTLREYATPGGVPLFYHSGGRYWRKALPVKLSSHYKPISVASDDLPLVFALLNSQLFYWYWISHSNCMDVVARDVLALPVFAFAAVARAPFVAAMERTLATYAAHSTQRARRGAHIAGDELNFDMRRAKPLIDTLDRMLARCYGFSDEELDFVLNYDVKYRVGMTSGEGV